jgi:hypothetical protein
VDGLRQSVDSTVFPDPPTVYFVLLKNYNALQRAGSTQNHGRQSIELD